MIIRLQNIKLIFFSVKDTQFRHWELKNEKKCGKTQKVYYIFRVHKNPLELCYLKFWRRFEERFYVFTQCLHICSRL